MKQREDYSEMQRKYQELEQSMHEGNPEYDSLRKRLGEVESYAPITKTLLWHWNVEKSDFPETFFYSTPLIGEASESNRILIAGTNAELRYMQNTFRDLEIYQRVVEELGKESSEYPGSVNPKIALCTRVGMFWESFFGEKDFLDNLDKISVPAAIIGTGNMRNYNIYGGETVEVRKRLEKIASEWGIPIQFVPPLTPDF
jgi:hypothetical protein